jgi:16S rRNA processing protein RimM
MPQGSAASEPPDLVELGVVRGAYGVKGWLRVALHGSDGAVLQGAQRWWLIESRAARAVEVRGCRRHGAALLAKWAGCDSKEAADRLRGALVALPRAEFPAPAPGEYYWHDLLGCRVVNRSGQDLGEVAALSESGAGQWLEVVPGHGGARLLIPLVEQFVERVDPDQRLIRVDWQEDW